MIMKTDKELADDLDAKKRIREHGGLWKNCSKCNGTGQVALDHGPGKHARWSINECFSCGGKGGHWEMPTMRTL